MYFELQLPERRCTDFFSKVLVKNVFDSSLIINNSEIRIIFDGLNVTIHTGQKPE